MKRVLLISTVHPATDSRIMYKIAPSLHGHYEVFCALPKLQSVPQPGIHPIGLPHFKRLLPRLLFAHPVALVKCLRLRPDIVHIFVPELIPMAFIFQWLGAEAIYEVQENLFKKFAIKKYNNSLIFKKLFLLFDKLARKKFHCIFTDDAYLEEYHDLAKPFAVVHNYVSLPVIDGFARAAVCGREPVFFYLGVVSMERCLDTMIHALASLKRRYPSFHLHLFGPVRVSRQELERILGFTDVKDHITFHGYTDQQTALAYATHALAGIALLKPVADYPESFPTKLFEYMALKLPVITSDFPLYRQIVGQPECGFCISPYDPDALCEKLERCIKDESKCIEMGANGRKTAETHYNWVSEEVVLLSFYNNIKYH
ncbi:glycosyltransferase family 4 protein [Dyadobacter sp. CY261]|uniref:glycosyltransferase family 4 protein n=1 Tax=Dyadobacter sp. CY261 TaxID=2907203 RepID=UPI001F3A508D|nr:glycosyltransferase family 4 protein [Dyadobacter sp. CY261]MCF0072552.1 glycosyltransferase family 4 protein [Dyadobacter sp. CY261]